MCDSKQKFDSNGNEIAPLPEDFDCHHVVVDSTFSEHTECISNSQISLETHCVRIRLSGKEVGSIIGKKGTLIQQFREESGAKITITDSSCPERIVTVTGQLEHVLKAVEFISQKFEADYYQNMKEEFQLPHLPFGPITLQLLVPGAQCGFIIGKGGTKIKEIRHTTGASINIANETLPQCSERLVTITGTAKSVTDCIRFLCILSHQCPAKGSVILYKPRPGADLGMLRMMPPHVLTPSATPITTLTADLTTGLYSSNINTTAHITAMSPSSVHSYNIDPIPSLTSISGLPTPLLTLPLGPGATPIPIAHNPLAVAASALYPGLMSPTLPGFPSLGIKSSSHTTELHIPNELVGCIIGRGGNKINEIRESSGAQIRIGNLEEGVKDRKITITGSIDQVQRAQIFIQQSIEAYRQMLVSNLLTSCQTGNPPQPNPPTPLMHHQLMSSPPIPIHFFSPMSTGGLVAQDNVSNDPNSALQQYLQRLPFLCAASGGGNLAAMFTGTPAISLFNQRQQFLPSGIVHPHFLSTSPFSPLFHIPVSSASFSMPSYDSSACFNPVTIEEQAPLVTKLKPSLTSNVPKYSPY